MRGLLALLLALGVAIASVSPAFAQQFPKLTGRVVDAAGIIPDAEEERLIQKLEALETQSQRQLVIATVPDLQGYDIADYGYQLGRTWGIGEKQRNDGALLIVAPQERKVRIEVGYGLEPVLTDGLSWQIIDTAIVPRFKQGDMPGGIEAGADALIHQLTLPAEEAQKIAAEAQNTSEGGVPIPSFFFILFILFFFVLPILRTLVGGGRRRRYGGLGAGPIIWSSGWGGGGGGFSGGGFSGGGGSFGGGGSSGSW